MKVESGIILTGGLGTRLAPFTTLVNKHLVPVFDKFVVDYPIKTLIDIGVKNLTVVLGGPHFNQIVSYIKDGSDFGMSANYVYQSKPSGIAQAINVCKNFINDDKFVVILGDNIYENPVNFIDSAKSAQIVLHKHPELYRFGVASFDGKFGLSSIREKPQELEDNLDHYAITGCYQFDQKFFEYFKDLKPSARGEYEITDIIHMYANSDDLSFTYVDGMWSDAGTHKSINFLNNFFYNKG